MPTGTVEFLNQVKGFGFVQRDDGGRGVFVRISDVARAGLRFLTEGQEVGFEVLKEKRGPRAVHIQVE